MSLHLLCMCRNVTRIVYNARKTVKTASTSTTAITTHHQAAPIANRLGEVYQWPYTWITYGQLHGQRYSSWLWMLCVCVICYMIIIVYFMLYVLLYLPIIKKFAVLSHCLLLVTWIKNKMSPWSSVIAFSMYWLNIQCRKPLPPLTRYCLI